VTQVSDTSLRELYDYSAERYCNISLDYKRRFLVFVCYPFFVVIIIIIIIIIIHCQRVTTQLQLINIIIYLSCRWATC
jgi:hypothetical protein